MKTQQRPTAWLVLMVGLLALTVVCGDHTSPILNSAARPVAGAVQEGSFDDWAAYANDRYAYGFDYPAVCRVEPLPSACKAQPPESRGPECQCFLNSADPDSVQLQAYLQDGEDLVLATWQVAHYDTPAFNPPPGTDLIDWIGEHFTGSEATVSETSIENGARPAVEVFTARSASAPSAVEIYYLEAGRLFRIQMLDVENAANVALYDRMLASYRIGVD